MNKITHPSGKIRRNRVYCAVLVMMILIAPPGSLIPVTKDKEITIIASGPWNGNFSVSESGEGGIAALFSWTEKMRYLRQSEGNDIVFIQNGNFAGQEPQTADSTASLLIRPELNLLRYMKWDVLHLSDSELLAVAEDAQKEEFRELRNASLVSWNLRQSLLKTPDFPVSRFRIIRKAGIYFFITGITDSEDKVKFSDESCSLLRIEMQRQTGADFFIIAGSDRLRAELSLCEEELFGPLSAADEDPVSLPWYKSYMDPPSHRTLFLFHGKHNAAYRSMHGAHVCVHTADYICEINVIFRNNKVTGLNTSIIRINNQEEPRSWITPDPLLMKLFRRT